MADESAVTVRFGGDVTGLDASVAVVKARLQAFNAEIRALAKEAAAAGGAADESLVASLKSAAAGAASAQKELSGLSRAKDLGGVSAEAEKVKKSLDTIASFAWNNTNLSTNQIDRVVNPLKYLVTTIGTVPTALGVAAAAAGASIASIAAGALRLGEQAEAMSSRFGLSADGVARLGAVASKAGIETKDLGEALRDLSNKARQGDENIVAAAGALGLSADQLKTKDLPGLLRTIQQAYDQNADGANKYAAMQALLGDSFEKLYPLMQQGAGFLDEIYAAADRSGAAIGGPLREALGGTIAASRDAGAAWSELKQSVEGAVFALYEHFKPAIDGAIQGFADLVRNIASAIQGFSSASREASGTALTLEAVATAAKALVTALALGTVAFETLLSTAKAVLKKIADLAIGLKNVFGEVWKAISGAGFSGLGANNVGGAYANMLK
jgi:hypothetical protein